MSYKSLTDINTTIKQNAGWCLSEARLVFGAPAGYKDAWTSWQATQYKHYDRNLPDVAVPVYFSWINKIIGDPSFGQNQGHVVSWIPSVGKFLSSPGSGYGQQWFGSIAEIESYFKCTFVGWSEDINGKRVAEYVPDAAPAPVATPVTTGQGGDFHLAVAVPGFVNANDAANHTNSNSTAPAGDYKIYNESNGMVNVTTDVNKPGYWINPGDNVAPAAPAPAPQAPAFAVGDTVAPNSADIVDYTGTAIHAWDETYTLTQLDGDRAVLEARGAVWAAVNIANIHKA